jgi:hypothetical protein
VTRDANDPKRGVPIPVTGSQPTVAFQLAYGTYGVASPDRGSSPVQPVDPPWMMSVNPCPLRPYIHGFRNPRVDLFAARRIEFRSAIIAAKVGADALPKKLVKRCYVWHIQTYLVPSTYLNPPWSTIAKFRAWAATSGKPRPLRL